MGSFDVRPIGVQSNPVIMAAVREIAGRNILERPGACALLEDTIEALLVLRDGLDGDLDLEDGDVDCCRADDDHEKIYAVAG